MDATNKTDDEAAQPTSDPSAAARPLNEAEADSLLEQKRKQGTSGLSWDEVVSDNGAGWREVTEMGEGD